MREKLIFAGVVLAILALSALFSYFQVSECTRLRPLWYCLTTGG